MKTKGSEYEILKYIIKNGGKFSRVANLNIQSQPSGTPRDSQLTSQDLQDLQEDSPALG